MRTAQRLAALGVVAAIVLSGCSNGKDSYSSAEKEESGQPLQSASISASSSVESAELAESANAGYPTLKEIAQNYNGCALEYPNMEELSVAWLYNGGEGNFCLFDVDGRVHHVFESGTYIASGFYNGMCMTSTRVMAKEDGTLFRPSYLSNDEIIIRYAKDDDGTLLWTVRREDSIEGTKAIITAWDTNGEIRFQCDTTRDEFSKMNSDTVYKDLANNDYDSIGISQAFAYCGGSVYRIRSDFYYVFMNIDTEKFFSVREPNAYLIQAEGNLMIRTMPALRALDDDFNELPEWEAIKSRRSETPVLSEGLIYLDVRRDAGDFEDYPSGFYDVHLNQVIDLSQYNIQSIYEDEPRFINGYAVLQMKNPEGVPFWGVIKRDGTWAAEPQKGSVRYVYQTADGVLITTCEENTEQWYTYDQTGTKLDEWDRIKFDGSYGYAQDSSSGHRGICEVYNGYTYASLNSHVAKISSDGSYEYLS